MTANHRRPSVQQMPDEIIAKLHEIADEAMARGQMGAALRALTQLGRMQGFFPPRPPRPRRKRPPRRALTLVEAVGVLAKGVKS